MPTNAVNLVWDFMVEHLVWSELVFWQELRTAYAGIPVCVTDAVLRDFLNAGYEAMCTYKDPYLAVQLTRLQHASQSSARCLLRRIFVLYKCLQAKIPRRACPQSGKDQVEHWLQMTLAPYEAFYKRILRKHMTCTCDKPFVRPFLDAYEPIF